MLILFWESIRRYNYQRDTDELYCLNDLPVIQDWCEWIPGVPNYLIVQDYSVYSRYCLLSA
jgi:hypothetical protein